jgi:hypothetical protein
MSCNLSERLSKTIPFSSTKIEQKQKRKDLQKKKKLLEETMCLSQAHQTALLHLMQQRQEFLEKALQSINKKLILSFIKNTSKNLFFKRKEEQTCI